MPQSHDKQKFSKEIIVTALETQSGVISWQVIQEFINVATKKNTQKMNLSDLTDYLNQILHPLLKVYPNIEIYNKAIEIISKTNYTYYDCLIIASAIISNCTIIFSEDLQHKQKIETVTILNPFIQ
jgi:predicted nucleic acid-binding protein